jgi:hypothetical protein
VQLPTATESQGGKSAGSASVLPEASAATKPKKEQPKGLRMRYRPSGYGPEDPGTIGASDSDEPRQPGSQFRASPGMNGHSKHNKKRKEREEESTNDAHEKLQKKKKHKDGPVKDDVVMEDIVRHEPQPQTKGTSKKSKGREHKALSAVHGVPHDKVNDVEESRNKDKEKKKKKKKRDKENV